MLTTTLFIPLAVGLVAPAFLAAGGLAIAIPILIHILNRRRFKVVQWAAMEYLLAAMRRNRRRLKFEQWLLLATRCLVLALLGLALARPLGCSDSSIAAAVGQRSGLHVFIIDNSYSMAYEAGRPDARTHLDQARRMAKDLIDRLSAGGESVAVITAAHPATAIIARPSFDLEAAKAAIDRISQSHAATDLGGALRLAADIAVDESRQPGKTLYILSDGTRSAWESTSAEAIRHTATELSRQYRVMHFNLGRKDQWNHAVQSLRPASNLVTSKFTSEFVVVPRGFGTGPDALLQWRVDDQVLPGGSTIRLTQETEPITQAQAALRTGGPHVVTATVISEDRLKADNSRHHVVEVASELRVLIVEGDRGVGVMSGSAAFLQIALAPPKRAGDNNATGRTDSYVAPEVISDLELGNKVLSDYRAVILTNVGQLQTSQADQLAAFVRQGGTLLLFMGEQVQADAYNQVLLPRRLMPGTLVTQVNSAADEKGFHFDFNPNGVLHPYLGIFRGRENSGLDTARVFTYWQLEPNADVKAERVLNYAKADPAGKQDPAITVHTVDQGRVVWISTTADDAWTSFPAKINYVALMHELLAGSVNVGDRWMNLTVGQSLEIPTGVKLTGAPSLTDPAQRPITLDPITSPDGHSVYRSRPLEQPGVYWLSTGSTNLPIVVNMAPEEADVRTLDDTAIRQALGEINVELHADQLPPLDETATAGHDFGWTVMVLVLAFVGVECVMAMRFSHQRRG